MKTLLDKAASMLEEIVAREGCPVCEPRPDPVKTEEHLPECEFVGLIVELRKATELPDPNVDLGRLRTVRDVLLAEVPSLGPVSSDQLPEGIAVKPDGERRLGRGMTELLEVKNQLASQNACRSVIPDPVERGEDRAEAAFEAATEGVPEGHYRCSCGAIVPIEDAHPYSVDPYSMPICSACLEQTIAKKAEVSFAKTLPPVGEVNSELLELQRRDEKLARAALFESALAFPGYPTKLSVQDSDGQTISEAQGRLLPLEYNVGPTEGQAAIVKLFETRTFVEAELEDIDAVDPRDETLTESRRLLIAIRDIITGEASGHGPEVRGRELIEATAEVMKAVDEIEFVDDGEASS